MLLVLGIFVLGNIVSLFTSNFTILLIARIIPAFFHPIYCSLAFIDNAVSCEMAMAFFGIVYAIVFIVTLLFAPSMPVEERLS